MDTPTQTPPENENRPKSKSAKPLIIGLVVVILALIGALVWCLLFYKGGHTDATLSDSSSPGSSSAATGPCKNGAANELPAGFTFYENATLGYKFAYPSAWGAVTVTTTPIAGETGEYVQGRFASKENAWFGGNATDYVVNGRDGIPTDLPGYLKSYNKFYTVELWRFNEGGTVTNRDDLHLLETPYEEKQGCNTVALITHWEASELSSIGPADVARFTLQPANKYYGVNVVVDKPTDADKADLDKLVGSFQLLP